MRSNLLETMIGAVVLLTAGYFLIFAYQTSGIRGATNGYELIAKFDRVDGLTVGSDVRLSGIKVGTIIAQTIDPQSFQAVVRLAVDGKIKLPEDTAARITAEGLLGSNYLSLEPGGSEKLLESGSEIRLTQGAVNFLDLIGQAIFSSTGGGKSEPEPAP